VRLDSHPFSLSALAGRFSCSLRPQHCALRWLFTAGCLVVLILRKLAEYSGAFRLGLTAVYDWHSIAPKTKKCV
jgi:hypothetical protein